MALGTRIKSFPQLDRELRKILRTVGSINASQALGEVGKDLIYERVKSGSGVNSDSISQPRKKRLKALSQAYIRQRRRNGVRGFRGRPAFSNLTNTGQMLESMTVRSKRGSFSIVIPNTRRDDGTTNAKVARHVRGERPFFAFTAPEKKILEKTVQKLLNKLTR